MENSFSQTGISKRLRLNDLEDRILHLYENNLITEDEQNNITSKRGRETENEIFHLLMQRDIKTSIEMLKILKNEFCGLDSTEDTAQFDTTEDRKLSLFPADNPMIISTVIQNVFRFLNLKDIQNCRYVCREWNQVSEPFLRKRSQISFGYPANASCFSKTTVNFNYDFRLTRTNMPFTALRLTSFKENSAPWPKAVLEELLQSWRGNLKELKIEEFRLQDIPKVSMPMEPFNITDLFPVTHLTKLNIDNRRNIYNLDNNWQQLQLSMEKLIHIKYLKVAKCVLKFKVNCRMSPAEVEIRDCSFSFPIEVSKNLLNTFIDFQEMQKFEFDCYFDLHQRNVLLDVSGNFELNELSLRGVEILNWSSSNWKIGKLNLLSVWQGKTNMNIKEMTVSYSHSFNSLSEIPGTVEKLNFSNTKIFHEQVSLPNLTHLIFQSHENNLECFQNCSKLTTLEIKKDNFYGTQGFSCNILPPTIRKLRIEGGWKITGNWPHHGLEKLIFDNCPSSTFNLVTKFKPEEVAITLTPTSGKNVQLFKFLKKTNKPIWIGRFVWNRIDFATSDFSALVDKQSGYYFFDNKRGTTIEHDEHERRMKL